MFRHKILWMLLWAVAVDRSRPGEYMRHMDIGTRIFTALNGKLVGQDSDGNRYYEMKRARPGARMRRWVIYQGAPEATKVPPEWHAWLHHTTDAPIPDSGRRFWQKPHVPNRTGTPEGYRPPGHDYRGGQRDRATGDYEAWTPGA